MTELKPCPFCGSEALISDVGECYCSKNDCIYFSTFTKDMWNTRPIEDELQRKLDIAKKALEEVIDWDNDPRIGWVRTAIEALKKLEGEG